MADTLEIVPVEPGCRYRVFRLRGRLDAQTSDETMKGITPLLTEGPRHLVGDLTELRYISSAGLNLLIHVCRELRKSGGDLVLAGVGAYVKEILDLTGYTKIFKVYPSVQEAAEVAGR